MRKRWPIAGSVLLLALLTGCDWFADPAPEMIEVVLEGEGDGFQAVTSTEFVAARNETGRFTVEVYVADTTAVSFPFERAWNIRQDQRFFFSGMPSDSASEITVRLRVFVDGSEVYDRTVLTRLGDPLRFVYLFNQQILQDFELL